MKFKDLAILNFLFLSLLSFMQLPPSKSGDQAEDALLVFSWSCDQDSNVTLEKSGPEKYKPTTL